VGKPMIVALAALFVGLAGCADMQEMQLAPNVVRMDVTGYGTLQIGDAMLRRAAELTLRSGYGYFRVTPLYEVTPVRFGVMVLMFHAGEPGSEGALDAASVLRGS
jgi:hypothetical protein